MPASRTLACALITAPLLMAAIGAAHALPSTAGSAVTIRNDRGGQVVHYALKMLRLKEAGHSVRFSGRCDSACTLYLALPRSKTCVSPGASFGFHLPYGASRAGNQVAAQYLLSSYPGWVRSWIADKGGTQEPDQDDGLRLCKPVPADLQATRQEVGPSTASLAIKRQASPSAWRALHSAE